MPYPWLLQQTIHYVRRIVELVLCLWTRDATRWLRRRNGWISLNACRIRPSRWSRCLPTALTWNACARRKRNRRYGRIAEPYGADFYLPRSPEGRRFAEALSALDGYLVRVRASEAFDGEALTQIGQIIRAGHEPVSWLTKLVGGTYEPTRCLSGP